MKKLFTALLIILQVLSLSATSFTDGNSRSMDTMVAGELSVSRVGGLATMLVTVKTGLTQQLRMAIELANLASTLKPHKKQFPQKDAAPVPQPIQAVGALSAFSFDICRFEKTQNNSNFSALFALFDRTCDTQLPFYLMLLVCLFMIDRIKLRRFFYLLPRGTIDDALFISARAVYCPYRIPH